MYVKSTELLWDFGLKIKLLLLLLLLIFNASVLPGLKVLFHIILFTLLIRKFNKHNELISIFKFSKNISDINSRYKFLSTSKIQMYLIYE